MKTNFNDCFNHLLKSEGGYTNDPSDSGGPTNLGITLKDYRLYINPNGTANDVKNLTVAQARVVYKTKYWDALDCDNLPSGVDYTCFDYGVLAGVGRPRKALQQFKSLEGIALIDAINDERARFLRGLAVRRPKDQKFLNGWMNRVNSVRAYSKELSNKKEVPTGSGTAAAAVVGGGFVYTYWHLFLDHWVLYSLGLITVAFTADCLIHWFKNRKITNV